MTGGGDHEVRIDLTALYRAHRLPLVRMAVLLVGDDGVAEDLVQDAFAGLHRNQQDLREPSAAIRYLRQAVLNGTRTHFRRRAVSTRHAAALYEPVDGPEADAELLLDEEHRAVLAAVRSLPPRQQQVIVLRYWVELSEAQIAETLDISCGAVKSQASRGLAKVEKLLEKRR